MSASTLHRAAAERKADPLPVEGSNSLADLAARIRAFHEATSQALQSSVENGIAAGELLIEAKEQLQHGQWLPWLRDNCAIKERTAQLYMRLAKNRAAIEEAAKTATVADLTLNETAALLMLSSDVRKLLNFARDAEHLSGDELIERCIAEGVGVIQDPNYDPLAGRTETEILEWHLFMLFQSFDADAGRGGGEPDRVAGHVEWILQRPFQNVTEWLGEEGDTFRRNPFYGRAISEQFKSDWAAFLAEHHDRALADVIAELKTLQQRFEEAPAAGRLRKRRQSRNRTKYREAAK